MNAGARVPRLRCSGKGEAVDWDHESVVLTIRSADPLVLECPICGERVDVDLDRELDRGVDDRPTTAAERHRIFETTWSPARTD